MICQKCGARFSLSADYITQYGGRTTTCQSCGNAMVIPQNLGGPLPLPLPLPISQGPGTSQVLQYAAPSGYQQVARGIGVWREGNKVVIRSGAALPEGCVKCNAPLDRPLKRTKYVWYPPVAYLGLLGGLLPFAILR